MSQVRKPGFTSTAIHATGVQATARLIRMKQPLTVKRLGRIFDAEKREPVNVALSAPDLQTLLRSVSTKTRWFPEVSSGERKPYTDLCYNHKGTYVRLIMDGNLPPSVAVVWYRRPTRRLAAKTAA